MNINHSNRSWDVVSSPEPGEDPKSEIFRVFGMIRRRWLSMVVGALVALALAVAFIFIVEPSYSSTVRILLDEDRTGTATSDTVSSNSNNVDEYIATQVKMIQSDVIGERVVRNLNLHFNGELYAEPQRRGDRVATDEAADGDDAPTDAEDAATKIERQRTLNALRRSVEAYRLDESFVIEIAANSPNAQLAQDIAAAYGQAYIDDQNASRLDANKLTGSWLETRLEDLRVQSLDAARAVQQYRVANNIVTTNGELVSDQQVTGLSNQSVLARQQAAESQARYEVFKNAVEGGDVDQLVGLFSRLTEGAENSSARRLATRYVEATDRLSAVTAQWGADNEQAIAVRGEVQRIGSQVLSEARRLLGSYRNDYRVAQAQLEGLSGGIKSAVGESEASGDVLVMLQSLEQRADSIQALYKNYLQRYQESVLEQSLPINAARMISSADLPEQPGFPNKKIILALSLVLGTGLGAAFGMGREFLDRSVRTGRNVTDLGIAFFGFLPTLSRREALIGGRRSPGRLMKALRLPRSSGAKAPANLLPDEIPAAFTPAIRRIKIALDLRNKGSAPIVGIASVGTGEGKTLVAASLAALESRSGKRVLLIDANPRNRRLSEHFAGNGVADAPGARDGAAYVVRRLENGVDFLPMAEDRIGGETIVSSVEAQAALSQLAASYDALIMDLGPLDGMAETLALVSRLDAFVFVFEWGVTDQSAIEEIMRSVPGLHAQTLGAVVNKTDMSRVSLYEGKQRYSKVH